MSTYLIKDKDGFALTRKAGDKSDIVFTVQDLIPLAGMKVKFSIFNSLGKSILDKTTEDDSITVTGQQIIIPISVSDLEGKQGDCFWEMQFSNDTDNFTAGEGRFKILKARLK